MLNFLDKIQYIVDPPHGSCGISFEVRLDDFKFLVIESLRDGDSLPCSFKFHLGICDILWIESV